MHLPAFRSIVQRFSCDLESLLRWFWVHFAFCWTSQKSSSCPMNTPVLLTQQTSGHPLFPGTKEGRGSVKFQLRSSWNCISFGKLHIFNYNFRMTISFSPGAFKLSQIASVCSSLLEWVSCRWTHSKTQIQQRLYDGVMLLTFRTHIVTDYFEYFHQKIFRGTFVWRGVWI